MEGWEIVLLEILMNGDTIRSSKAISETILDKVEIEDKNYPWSAPKKYVIQHMTKRIKDNVPLNLNNMNGEWGTRIGALFKITFIEANRLVKEIPLHKLKGSSTADISSQEDSKNNEQVQRKPPRLTEGKYKELTSVKYKSEEILRVNKEIVSVNVSFKSGDSMVTTSGNLYECIWSSCGISIEF